MRLDEFKAKIDAITLESKPPTLTLIDDFSRILSFTALSISNLVFLMKYNSFLELSMFSLMLKYLTFFVEAFSNIR